MKNTINIFGHLLIPALLLASNPIGLSQISINQENRYPVIGECGTIQALRDARRGREIIRPPSGPKYIYSNHFLIHFDTTGTRAVTRAQAESISKFIEYSWAKEVDTLGWRFPPPDSPPPGDKYDVYINGIDPSGYHGVTYAIGNTGQEPATESWIELTINPNHYWNKPLTSHEFNHACQYSYSFWDSAYWYENTAEWIEKVVWGWDHDRIGDGGDNPDPLENPQVPIDDTLNGYEYAGGLWPRFLEEYFYDISCPRRIWELCGEHRWDHTIEDTDSILGTYYDSSYRHIALQMALGHYAIWRYFTGPTRGNPLYFFGGNSYITSTVLRTWNTYPVIGNQETSNPSGPGGCNFIRFTNLGDNRITIYFDGENGHEWTAYVLGIDSEPPYEYKIPLEPFQDTGRITLPGWEYTEVILIPVVTEWENSANNLTFNYTATFTPHLDRHADGVLGKDGRIFSPMLNIKPNPFKSQTVVRYALPEGSINSSLEIFDASGSLVTGHMPPNSKSTLSEAGRTTSNCFVWDGRNAKGKKVANGIYFCRLTTDAQTIQKRLVMLR